MTNDKHEPSQERRVDHETRARITRDERAALRAQDRRYLVTGIAILTAILLLVFAAQAIATIRGQNDRDRSTRESCVAGNKSRAQIRTLAQASPGVLKDIEESTPIIDCDLLPRVRREVPKVVAEQFVRLVAEGAEPIIRDGRIAFTP